MKTHPLIKSLINFKGNVRGCVYPEPLNAIPANLYTPYYSIYMLALGITDTQIGLVVSIGWFFQLIMAIFSGVITDKLGRRLTTFIFDIISWTIPAIVWAAAQNFWFFVLAAFFSSFTRVTQNSWMCLMVEDSDPEQLIDLFSWIYIAGMLSAFFVPLAGVLIKNLTLVPTMRILYGFAAVSFTVKAFITYFMTSETQEGLKKLQATQGVSIFISLTEYKSVFKKLVHTPKTLYTAGIMLIMSICTMINGTFWAIIATEKIKIPAANLSLFPFVKSFVMLILFFMVVPRLQKIQFKVPMAAGFACFALSQCLLILAPVNQYPVLLISILLEAFSLAILNPLADRMMVTTIDAGERARIQSILYVGIILVTSPFGWIAGRLSSMDKSLPFVLNIVLLAAGGILVFLAARSSQNKTQNEEICL